MRVRITEYLEIDLDSEQWICQRCGRQLAPARESYKKGLVVAERDLEQVHPRRTGDAEYGFTPDPDYCRLLEFYCPGCGTLVENEYLPPGHPLTHDIELDLDSLRQRYLDAVDAGHAL